MNKPYFLYILKTSVLENLKDESLVLCYSLQNTCNGELNLKEIANRIGKSVIEIKKMLGFMGKQVKYKKKYSK